MRHLNKYVSCGVEMAFDFEALTSREKVTAVYVAYYGRAADAAGRNFWSNQLEGSNGDLSAIIDAFGTSPEALQRFGTLSNEAAVRTLYRDLFNREPEQEGLDFYVGELEAGRLTLQSIALDVLNGAQNDDASIASNKITAGESYTDALIATGTEATPEDTRVAIAAVDETDASLEATQDAIEALTGQQTGITVRGNVLENDSAIAQLTSPVGTIDVGTSTAGFLGITGGTSLTIESDGFDNLQAGTAVGGSGTIILSGTGTSVVTRGTDNTTQVGRVGEGVLLVSNGARLETLQLEAGREGQGEVLISGQGTEVVVTPANGIFSGEFSNWAGFVRAGRDDGSYGRIVLSDGALLDVRATAETTGPGMDIARNAGSRGEVIVDAATARFAQEGPIGAFGPFINVGLGGEGTLDVRNSGSVTLSGETSTFMVGRSIDQGQGEGTLNITGGGRVEALFYNVGVDGAKGHVSVSGPESTFAAVGSSGASDPFNPEGTGAFVTVGRSGEGTLAVQDGGQVTISSTGTFAGIQAGRDAGSDGTIVIDGNGSRLEIAGGGDSASLSSGWAKIGRSGTGELQIVNGGQVVHDELGVFVVGAESGGAGTVTLNGSGSTLDAGSALLIGADVPSGLFSAENVNFDPGATGNVSVGNGAELEAGGQPNDGVADIFIGANGTLEIESGGTLVGDVRVVGGSFDLADGAIHQGELIT